MMNPTLIINAGGKSRRMGQTKALLPVPPNNQPLIAHIAQRLRHLSPHRTVVVTNDPEVASESQISGSVDFVRDRYLGLGALGGIATALHQCEGWVIMVACDMPLVNPALFEMLCGFAEESDAAKGGPQWDAVVPFVRGFAQTMHALYHHRCLPAIEARLNIGELRVADFLGDVRTRTAGEDEIRPIDPTFQAFMNVNTPAEWKVALTYLRDKYQ